MEHLNSNSGSSLIFLTLTTDHKCNSPNRGTMFDDVTYPQTYTLSASHMQHTSLYMKRSDLYDSFAIICKLTIERYGTEQQMCVVCLLMDNICNCGSKLRTADIF